MAPKKTASPKKAGKRKNEGAESAAKKPKKVNYKKALMDMAKESTAGGKNIGVPQARALWMNASDGPGVTQNEFATLERILREYSFTKKGRVYLDSLVTKHESGTSMYKTINKVKYDRSCLDLATHLAKDGSISLPDARLLWDDVLDGPGVTACEKRTIERVMENFKLSAGAIKFFKDHLKEWEAAHPEEVAAAAAAKAAEEAAEEAATAAATAAAPATTTTTTAASATPRAAPAAASPSFGFGDPSWHGSAGFGQSLYSQTVPRHFAFKLAGKAFGLFVSGEHVYAGDETGQVVKLDHEGNQQQMFLLPEGVKCMVADDGFVFAGCNNGSLYDLTHKEPRLVAQLEDFSQILWLDIHKGLMVASDAEGNVALINCEGETMWKKKSRGDAGWMVRVDDEGVYHGHSKGVTKYDISGKELWHTDTEGVLFGWQEGNNIYAGLVEPNCFDGEIAKRLSAAGAKSGDIVASLMWNTRDDLDLHMYSPTGHISYCSKKSSCGKGELDVDMNAGGRMSDAPVENIYWRNPPAGHYRIGVINFSHRTGQAEVPFEVHVNVQGEKEVLKGTHHSNVRKEIIVKEFDYAPPDGVVAAGKLKEKAVVTLDKATGKIKHTYDVGSSVPSTTCSPEEDQVFIAVPQAIKCFDDKGVEQWTLGTGGGNCMTMQYAAGNKLFAVAGDSLLCMDVSADGIKNAKQGAAVAGRALVADASTATRAVSAVSELEAATAACVGIKVHCVMQGSKVRVRPMPGQAGYSAEKNVQFPRNIRQNGAKFLVEALRSCGSFYRVVGTIKRLD